MSSPDPGVTGGLSLSDLLVATEPYEGKLIRATRPAALADLRAVLEAEGAEVMVAYGHKLGDVIVPNRSGPRHGDLSGLAYRGGRQ